MSTKRQYVYAIGDRVAERPKGHALFASTAASKERLIRYRNQRYGTVLGFSTKKTSRGAMQKYVLVRWDGLASTSEHSRSRICPVDQLQRLQSEGYGFDIE